MVNQNNNLAVLIMIGGQSSRMGGGIKSFIKFNNRSIFDRIFNNINHQTNQIIINCNDQHEKIKEYNLPIVNDLKVGFLGPLAGIHAGMHWLINNKPEIRWLITIPGDTPFIPKNIISKFNEKLSSKIKIILTKSNDNIHPIIGAWHTSLFNDLEDNLNKGTRKILKWTETYPLDYLKYSINDYDPFFNINTKEDVINAKQIERDFL